MSDIVKSEHADTKPEASITICVKDQGGDETLFKVKRTTKMSKVFDAFASRKNLQSSALRFILNGERVSADQTPGDLDMSDDDHIDCLIQQIGGNK